MKERFILPYVWTIVLTLIATVYLYPLFLVLINSFKTFQEITSNVIALPTSLEWHNFANTFKVMNYPRYFLNTLAATSIGVLGVVSISSMAGYKLSRTNSRISFIMFMVLIAPMMIPFHSFMISLVKVAKELKLIGSPAGLGVLYWGLGASLALFMYHGAVKSVPRELDDCASIDGASPLRTFFKSFFHCSNR